MTKLEEIARAMAKRNWPGATVYRAMIAAADDGETDTDRAAHDEGGVRHG